MSAVWSYVLAGVGISGLLIAARRPRVGWWFNISAQALWAAYAIATRQWGFLASTAGLHGRLRAPAGHREQEGRP